MAMIDRTTTLAVWATLGALVFLLVASDLLLHRGDTRLGAVVRRVTARSVGRAVLVLGWMWLGWHAFAR
jgi:hypothetical protein